MAVVVSEVWCVRWVLPVVMDERMASVAWCGVDRMVSGSRERCRVMKKEPAGVDKITRKDNRGGE